MEGDGEDLVAIVQGLDTAGVSVTVCNRTRHNSDRRRSSRPRIQINTGHTRPADMLANDHRSNTLSANSAALANQRSSVETSTGTDFARQHRSSQICDGRYASSYTLAHCMVTPTSPPEAVSEFPPQRREPCHNQGNFEIGGHGSGRSSGKVRVSTSRARHYGGTQTWGDKGSSHRYCKSNRDNEAFALSLRKYPNMAPFRTASTDLIEKLIRYTQAKNFQEMSRSSNSMRSLRQQKSAHTSEMAGASKYQQTYTRTQRNNDVNNGSVQVGHKGRARNFKLYSPMSDSRNLKQNRHRATFSSSYDYLKAGVSPNGRTNRSDESPSPVGSSSPGRTRSPEGSRSPDRLKSVLSPVRFKSIDGFRSPDRPNHADRPIRFERSARDLTLSDMSKYIRSTVRQICNERPVVFQVCPKLKDRYIQHKKACSSKCHRANDVMEDEPDEDRDQASGSVLSRLIQSLSACAISSTEQAGCQCTRADCYCTKATQCVNNPDTSTYTHSACSCKISTKIGCCRGMPCFCAVKSQDQAYYNKLIDEEIAEWLKEVPVHSIEGSDSKKKRDTAIKELRKTLKQLPDDENYDENARNEITSFIEDFPLWNPGKHRKDEKLFKNQFADQLTERILSVPRKPDRFRYIVKKWVANLDFEDDGEEVDKEAIIDKIVNKLKSMAVDRPSCDVKYTHTVRKEIIELLVELALKFDGNMAMLKKLANKLATEIVSIPRNVNLSGDTTDLTDEFEENVSDWICEHGLCGEFKKDPKLIESLARKLNKLKSQGIDNECVVEKMKEEIHQFVDDLDIAIETIDELIDELIKQLSNTVQTNEMEKLDQDELTEVVTNWLNNLPSAYDLHPRTLEKITKELVKMIIEGRDQGNENLANHILTYLADADLGIDPADLGIYVEELMEKLNLLPSKNYHNEQIKKQMIKYIFNIIENLTVPESEKKVLRSNIHQIVENRFLKLTLNSKEDHDDMKDAIMEDMHDAISRIDIPNESRLKLKASFSNMFNSNFEKSFMGLKTLSEERSDLKQTIAKDVRNAVKELPIDTDKKKVLMQQVKGTLSKNMHKPLPSNVKNIINDEISDILERCPISEDNSILGSLKKMLSAVASKHLNICVPKCVCDIQDKVETDVGIVIDRSSIDNDKKKKLKKSIHDILTENEDCQLSDEVVKSIKEDISGAVSDLSIPQHKKDVLKKTVGETISKDFTEALSNLRHDLNKIRNKLFDDICNIIEKSPIPRDVKTHLKNKLKSVLAQNLDSSLSDKEKYTILHDVSNIVKDDMSEEKRRSLTNKLAKKLDTKQRKEDTNEIDESTEYLKKLENKILENILREMEKAVKEAPIPREKKDELRMKVKDLGTVDYKKPAEDIAKALMGGINEILDELIDKKDELIDKKDELIDKKDELKSELAAAIDEYSKLLKELKKERRSRTDANSKQRKFGNGLMPIEEIDETKPKANFLKEIEKSIAESAIPEETKMELKTKLKKLATDNLTKPFSDDVQDAIKIGIADILDELQVPKPDKNKLKHALMNMMEDYFNNLQAAKQPVTGVDETKAKESILKGIEKIIAESAIPEETKMELKTKLKKMATDNLKKPFSDDVQDAIKIGIADILDELQIPKAEKNKLKRALIDMTNDYSDNLRAAKQPVTGVDETEAKDSILKGIEKIIAESAIPEDEKMELKKKLKKMATDNLKKPFSDDVQDAIKIGIADILDELQVPKAEKNKLKRALIDMTDEYSDNLRAAKQPVTGVDETKAKDSILKGIEKIIAESAIPEDAKMKLKKKLKKMATDNLKKPFSDDVQDAIKIGIADILDELQIPKAEKNKLKRALIDMTNDYSDNLRAAKQPVTGVDETEAKDSILKGIEKIIAESAIPEDEKMELKKKLKKMATDNLKKPFSDDVQDAIKIGIADILDELQVPKAEKNKLKRALIDMTDEYSDNLRAAKQPVTGVDETKAKDSILKGIEKIIAESAIPEDAKMKLKKKLKKMATDNLKKPFSDDVQDAIKIGIADILDELQVPKAEKNKLKRALIDMTDDYLDNLRAAKQPVTGVDETKANESILKGIEKIIAESAIPEETKMELKTKLKKLATDNLKKPFSGDVQDAIKIGIADILDELPVPKAEKNKLKRALIDMIDEYLDNLRAAKQPVTGVDETKAKDSILKGIEKIIAESAIPEDAKMELKKKLKKMATNNLKKPFSDDVQDAIKIGIADILDELPVPKAEKNKLKRALIDMTDEYSDNLRAAKQPVTGVDETKAKDSILKGIEKIIAESAIPEETKKELKKKLKKMATERLNKPFSDDVQNAIKIGIADVLDEMQVPKAEKNKLKRALMNTVDDYLDNLRAAKQPVTGVDETKAKESILKGIEKIIAESAIPEETKMELKTKLKKLATDNLKKPFSDDVQDAIKIGIADILDELPVPKAEKNKLKRALIDMTDEYLDNLRAAKQPVTGVDETKAKYSILKGVEKIIAESAIPEDAKMELKKKLKKMATDNLKKPFSDDVQDAIKIGIADILDELPVPKAEKNKLKRALIDMTDKYSDNLRAAKQPVTGVDETKAKDSILKEIEKIIAESAIPEETKKELKKKLKKMATERLNKPFSDDVQNAIKIGIADILDEMQVPKAEKNKLKRALIDMTDEYLDNLRAAKQPVTGVDETKANESILKGIEKIIAESAIPEDEKMELKKKLKKMATDNLKKPFSDDVQDAIKIGIADILDELQVPKTEKNKLKRALVDMTDDYLDNLRAAKQPVTGVDETKAKESILKGIEKIIAESAIPEETKMELKMKLKKMATINLKKPFSDDVQNAIKIGIADILDELQVPKAEKNKLKRALMSTVDDYLDNLRAAKQPVTGVDETKAKESILKGIEKIIAESAIPEETKMELKTKLKKMATDNLKKPFSDDVQDAIKIGIADILDELPVPKAEKNKLKRALIDMTDDYLGNLRTAKQPVTGVDEAKAKDSILKGIEKIIAESAIPEETKKELKKKLKKMATERMNKPFSDDVQNAIKIGIADVLDEMQVPKTEKNELKRALIDMTDEYLDNFKFSEKDKKIKFKSELTAAGDENLTEKETNALAHELIGRVREITLKKEIYELDPSYVKTLQADINDLVDIALVGGDFKDARRKLTEKLMREQNLPKEEASVCVDDLIGKAQKLALAALAKDKSLLYKKTFAKAISDAVDLSTLSKPDKSDLKNKLLSQLNETIDNSPNLNDKGALTANILKDSMNIVDISSLPTDKKKELKLLLQQAIGDASKELMDDEEISGEAFAMFMDKIAETVKTWMDKLLIDLDPEVATAAANDIASDILDRQKYLQIHPEAVGSDKDEIENLKYQIFRRMKNLVDSKDMVTIMDGIEELYRMLKDLEPLPGFPKFGVRGLVDHN